jgi:transcription-repair coupling factor (superfamily II helicase)
VAVCLGRVSSGFVWPDEFLAIITEEEIFGVKHYRKRRGNIRRKALQKKDFKTKNKGSSGNA